MDSLDEPAPGTYDICAVCGWEDDLVQFHDPDFRGGANRESLREAQAQLLQSSNASAGEEYRAGGVVGPRVPAGPELASTVNGPPNFMLQRTWASAHAAEHAR